MKTKLKKRISAFISITLLFFCRSTPYLCHKYANCTNTDGGYYCECKYGWTGDGYKDCTVILDVNGKCSNDICDEVECKVRVLKTGTKVGCVFPTDVISILPHDSWAMRNSDELIIGMMYPTLKKCDRQKQ